MVDSTGKETYRNTERTFTGGRHNSADVEIMRDDLCRILFEAVGGKVEYIFEDSIASLIQDESGVDVTFETSAPRRFDLVIGADGLHSTVRRLAFGSEEQFFHDVGMGYIATFGIPNFLGLERWEVFYLDGDIGVGIMALEKDADARTYLGFNPHKLIDYDYRDIDAQKRLLAEYVAGAGWVVPQIVEHMLCATDFHFDSPGQIRMDNWSRRRIVLVGDAGYSISPATGQGTTVAIVGAYILTGELAAHKDDLVEGIASYENELRDYVIRNQNVAFENQPDLDEAVLSGESQEAEDADLIDGLPDLGQLVQPLFLKSYPSG